MHGPKEGDGTPLERLEVLFLDAQATAADPSRGALLEIGWARGSASACATHSGGVTALVVAPPPGAALPPAVARVTGLGPAEWARGTPAPVAWGRLRHATSRVGLPPVPTVVHFARFEEPHLRSLHVRHGEGPFPLDLVCTHAIARRLLPELPRRTLRALAGYFGAGVPPLRRSAEHVHATALVWGHLVRLLAGREGIHDLAGLREWLSRPARRVPRRFPLLRERRLALPCRPGVYRFLRAGGVVLYVGKATSLRHRVSGHFHARGAERALEMLTQAREVSVTETETPLEAALLEADEIKRHAPPFNVALAATGRAVWFATADLRDPRPSPDARHTVGPLASPGAVEALAAFRDALVAAGPPSLARRARSVGADSVWAPGPTCFTEGLALFVRAHGRPASPRELRRLGGRLWAERRAASLADPAREDPAEASPSSRRPAWDAQRVAHALEETVVRAAHAVRRGRWLARLSESCVAWTEPATSRRRLLVLERGEVVSRADLEAGARAPVPPGHARSPAERRAGLDVAAFDRLRVLTTELRGLAATDPTIELRLGCHARLDRRRLRAVLHWV